MASTARANLRGRLGVLVAGSLVVMALTTATAAASAPTPMGAAADLTRVRASYTATSWDGSSTRPRTGVPGFLLDRGRYTPVAIPRRLAATAPQGIVPTGINDRHQIVGEYIDDGLMSRGFLLDKGGRFTRIDVPGALGTNAAKINNRGQIVGAAQTPAATSSLQRTGPQPPLGMEETTS
jgi:hypothetical protein